MAAVNIDKCYEAAVNISKKAGAVIVDGFYKIKNVEEKTSPRDVVTETDKDVEKMVIEDLQAIFPDHKFIGEESVAAGAKCDLTDAPTWIIDPVDGTLNFVHCLPYTCISLALWVEKEARVAVVFNPILNQLYTAKKGEGAYLNGRKINVSGQKDLSNALIMTELGLRPEKWKMDIVYSNTKEMVSRSHGIRCLGSAALHICHVADGGADASISIGLFAWDKAAGTLLVEEAGGVVIDNAGGPHDIMRRRVLCASSAELAKQLVDKLQTYEEPMV